MKKYKYSEYREVVEAVLVGIENVENMQDLIALFSDARDNYGDECSDVRTLGIKVLKYIVEMCEYMFSKTEKEEYLDTRWDALKLCAKWRDVDSYFLYLERKRDDDKKFYEPRREKFLQFGITNAMQDLLDGEIDLLTISMPPGTGKSTAGIFFLSGVMGWYPEMPNLASAHSGLLTRSFYDGVSQILEDADEYTWREIFPKVKYNSRNDTNSKEQTINVGKPKRFKSLTCRAIGGSLTGATRCEKILYADDLCSGIEEALSPDRLEKLWMRYNTDLKTRKKGSCREIHIQTRWSVRDVVGRLIADKYDDPRARFISIPALNEDGESNFDYDYGVGFSKEYFEDMRKSMDDVSFKCLFQNEPIEREGLLYHPEDFERYYELPDRDPDAIIGICDTKGTGSDYCYMPIMYQYGDKYFYEDCVFDNNGDMDVVDMELVDTICKHKPHRLRFESNSAGGRTADVIQGYVRNRGCRTEISKKYTTSNKETKIIVNSAWIKSHVLIKDSSMYTEKSQYGKSLAALFSYSLEGKNKHDDVPDGMAMFSEYVQDGYDVHASIMSSPF